MENKEYKKDCFAFRQKLSGVAVCIALNEIECENCSFYKDRESYRQELIRCEEHNKKTGSAEKYGKFKPLEFDTGGVASGGKTSV